MNKDNFDKQIREKLAHYEVAPSPAVWESIQGQLAASAKRQYGWLAGLFFLLVAAGATYYFVAYQDSAEGETSQVPATSQLDPISDPSFTERSASLEDVSETSQAQGSAQNSTSTSAVSLESATSRERTATESNTKVRRASSKATSAKAVLSASDRKSSKKRSSSTSESALKSSQKSQKEVLSAIANSTVESNNRKSIPEEKELAPSDPSSDVNLLRTQMRQTAAPAAANTPESMLEKAWESRLTALGKMSATEDYTPVQTAAFLTLEERQREVLDQYDICDVLFSSIEDCPKFGDRRRRYQIDAYAQTGMLFSHLTNNNLDVEVNSYLNKRRSTETPMWHLGFGVRLSTQWTSGVSLRGGLQISQSQIRVDYRDETQRQTTVNVSIDTIVDGDGNTTVVWDTISVIETGIEDRRLHNTFTQIDIPLTVGYTFFGPRYDVEVNAGVMFNVLFQRSGRVLGPEDNQFYELGRTGAPAGTQPYNSDLGLSAITSVALNYRLSHQFSVFVEPQLRYFLKPVSPGGYALQENWFMGSVMLGGRYAF